MEQLYNCDKCDLVYKTRNGLQKHSRTKHPNPNKKKSDSFNCQYCQNVFKYRQSKWLHEQKCKTINSVPLAEQVKKLTEKVKTLENKSNIITNNISNSNNNSNNNIIVINKIGTENINDLNEKEIKEIFANNIESLIKFVQHTNFNSRLPSNHNFCTTSLDGQYLTVYNADKSSQEKERKKYFFEELIKRSIIKMEKLYNKYRNNFNKEKQKKIEEDIMILKDIRDRDMNDVLLREMLKKLNLLSYNYKEVVMKTWEKPDTIGMKEKTFEEDLDESDSDLEIKEIESIFLKQEEDDDSDGEDGEVPDKPKLELKKVNNKKEIEV
jgi:hypothetical protein